MKTALTFTTVLALFVTTSIGCRTTNSGDNVGSSVKDIGASGSLLKVEGIQSLACVRPNGQLKPRVDASFTSQAFTLKIDNQESYSVSAIISADQQVIQVFDGAVGLDTGTEQVLLQVNRQAAADGQYAATLDTKNTSNHPKYNQVPMKCSVNGSAGNQSGGASQHNESNGFTLASNGKVVTCSADDNYSFTLNAARTKIKVEVEGESAGPKSITSRNSDGDTQVAYTTSEGTLDLNDQGNTWVFAGSNEPAWKINCH